MSQENYVGRRVKLTEKYAQYIKQKTNDGDCRTGVITNVDEYILSVDLDNGNSCMPYKWGHTNPQCELIPEQILKISELKGSKVARKENCRKPYLKLTNMTTEQRIKQIEDNIANQSKELAALKDELKNDYRKGEVVIVTDNRKTYITHPEGDYSMYTTDDARIIDNGNIATLTGKVIGTSGSYKICEMRVNGSNKNYYMNEEGFRKANAIDIANSQTKIVKIGSESTQTSVTIKKGSIICEGKTIDPKDIERLLASMTGKANSINDWKIEVKKVDVGCCKEITIVQLQELQKEYNRING